MGFKGNADNIDNSLKENIKQNSIEYISIKDVFDYLNSNAFYKKGIKLMLGEI